MKEVKAVVQDCRSDKAPSPEGPTMLFFMDRWSVIKDDPMKVLEEFYEKGVVNGIVN